MAKRSLGHYDAAHNTIVVSRVFDRPSSPRYALEYLLYHEMLHLKHPVRMRGVRRCVHSREFKAEEALFPELAEALAVLTRRLHATYRVGPAPWKPLLGMTGPRTLLIAFTSERLVTADA